MAPIVLEVLQYAFLAVLYLFVWRIARAIIRDVRASGTPRGQARASASPGPPAAQRTPRRAPPPPPPDPPHAQPSEIVIHRAGSAPRVLPLDDREITFGRAEPATIVLDDPYVSDSHARIWNDGGAGWVVSDLGSTNGTFLNQVKVTRPTPLTAGDQLGIGKTMVEVRR